MRILKISSMKEKFNDNEKNPFKIKLINKIKATINVIENIMKSQNVLIKKETKCQKLYICKIKYN